MRWIRANSERFGIHKEAITALGGSAGSFLSLMLGVANEEDYRDELSVEEDPTLAGTHLEESSSVQAIVDHWGGTTLLSLLTLYDGQSRFDATDAPVQIVHGTQDTTVSFVQAEAIRDRY